MKDIPRGMVLRAGTYQGTDAYAPVHPSQNSPITRRGPAIIAPQRRSSGGTLPFHNPTNGRYRSLSQMFSSPPTVVPMRTPMYIKL